MVSLNSSARLSSVALVIAGLVMVTFLLFGSNPGSGPKTNTITDVSWPNCSLRSVSSEWGIVGVTGGLDLRPNKCAAAETGWFSHYALYMNTGYPGIHYAEKFANSPRSCSQTDERCVAYNYGYNASLYAIKYAASRNLHSDLWWLDVETDNSWSTKAVLNRASLQGSLDALHQTVIFAKVGIYSYPAQWQLLTSSWHNGLPAWVATGSATLGVAQQACQGPGFDGGQVWLGQYTPNLDANVPCGQQFYQATL